MRNWPERRQRKVRVEIIPMIDVMMFLLVFFVLISVNVIPNRGLNVTVPTSGQTDRIADRRRVTVTIGPEEDLFLDGEPVDIAALRARLTAMTADGAERPLVTIAGDAEAGLQALVDVIGALKVAGISGASIVARPQ